MQSIQKFILLVVLTSAAVVSAGQIRVLELFPTRKEIIILQEKEREKRWKADDPVCIVRDQEERICGKISRANPYRVTILLDKGVSASSWNALRSGGLDGFLELVFGEELSHRSPAIRVLASQERIKDRSPNNTPISVSNDLIAYLAPQGRPSEADELIEKNQNFTFGMTYLFPTFQFQFALGSRAAFGVKPQYLSASPGNTTKLAGIGGFATLVYFHRAPFNGFNAQAGLGGFSLVANVAGAEMSYLTPAGNFEVGWRFLWRNGLNVGLALGGEYLMKQPTGVDLGFSGFFPTASLDLGFAI